MATFGDVINAIPFEPRSEEGTGFLPPVIRAMGHILHCVALATPRTAVERINAEISAAMGHWNNATLPEGLSSITRQQFESLTEAINMANAQIGDWITHNGNCADGCDCRIARLRNLSNRVISFSSRLDRELMGIRETDPGAQL